jgi:peptide/nickel transport system substrate-binding protein
MAGYRGAIWAGSQIFNGLVETDRSGTIVPCLAQSWTVDPAGTTWTFSLRTDVWFHDDPCFGPSRTRRFTAHDVQYTFERICDASTKTTGLWVFRTRIDGASAYHEATKTGRSGRIRGITVVNDSTIRITLTKPFAPFLALLTIPYAWIVPREAIHTYGSEFARHPVGTGPFAFESWKQDVELRLRRNPRYFKSDSVGRRLPYLETIAVTFLRDRKNEFLEFIRGNYDMVTSIDNVIAATIFEANGTLRAPYDTLRAHRAAAQSVEYYGMLLDTAFPAARQTPLATNRLLRQALNYAIDRHRIVTYLLGGRGIPASYGVLPPTMPGFSNSVRGYTYDPDRARDLLASAGYPNGKGLPELTLQLGNSDKTAAVAEAVQQMWREVGIRVNLRMIDFPQHLAQVRAGDLHLWRTSWLGDYPDPENFLALFVSTYRSPNGPNTTRLHRADLDSLYAAALHPARSFEDRAALYNRMEQIVLDEAPWVLLYHDVNIRLTLPSVHGFSLDGSDRLILEHVSKHPVGLLSRNQRSAF